MTPFVTGEESFGIPGSISSLTHIAPSGSEEYKVGVPLNAPTSNLNFDPLKTDKVAGFQCMAPLMSNGCAVAAPPIDMFTAPTPCIKCPVCAKAKEVANNKINFEIFLNIISGFMIVKICNTNFN